jgi:predicted nucleotidyltransferase
MIEEILNSEVKARIMKLFSKFPDSQFQAGEIAKITNLSFSRTNNTLKWLAEKGILEYRKKGKGSLFKANKDNYITRIILETFEKEKGLVNVIVKDFVSRARSLGKVRSIVLFGSALKELKFGSDIDFMVISEEEGVEAKLGEIGAELTEKYGFHISSVFMTVEELKRKKMEAFIINVIAECKTVFGRSLEEIAYGKGNQEG